LINALLAHPLPPPPHAPQQVVINFDAPRTLETYLHRIGRTARAGASGAAVTLAEDADRKLLREVVKRGRAALRQRLVPGPAVAAWQGKVEKAEPDVQEVRLPGGSPKARTRSASAHVAGCRPFAACSRPCAHAPDIAPAPPVPPDPPPQKGHPRGARRARAAQGRDGGQQNAEHGGARGRDLREVGGARDLDPDLDPRAGAAPKGASGGARARAARRPAWAPATVPLSSPAAPRRPRLSLPAPSRPARTWFQSEREKKAVRDAAKAAADGAAPGPGKEAPKDAKSKKREKLKERRAAEAEAKRAGRANKLVEETEEVRVSRGAQGCRLFGGEGAAAWGARGPLTRGPAVGSGSTLRARASTPLLDTPANSLARLPRPQVTRKVKSIKSRTRELQQQGLPAAKAAKIAAAAVTGGWRGARGRGRGHGWGRGHGERCLGPARAPLCRMRLGFCEPMHAAGDSNA
jgi:superfamily II DNA/RNA helicase